jgi:hypothetical protein
MLRISPRYALSDPDAEIQASGGLLPGPDAVPAGPTYRQWLESAG